MISRLLAPCINYLDQLKSSPSREIVGIDLGAKSIKLLVVKQTNPLTIQNFAISPTPKGAIFQGQIKDPAMVGQIVARMLKENNISSNSIAIAIPRLMTIIKNFTVDKRLNADEIESRTWLEANRFFPELIGSIYLDYSVLGPPDANSTQVEVMLVACRKEQVQPYLNVLESQNLNISVLDVNCYALERALISTQKTNQTVALINIDLDLITLIIAHNNKLLYIHEYNYDGNALMTAIQGFLSNINNTNNINLSSNEKYLECLQELSPHLRHTMQFYYSSKHNTSIQQVILSGDFAVFPNIALAVNKIVGIDCTVANFFEGFKISPEVDALQFKHESPALLLSYGLAMSKCT